jgi:hypothetical protein
MAHGAARRAKVSHSQQKSPATVRRLMLAGLGVRGGIEGCTERTMLDDCIPASQTTAQPHSSVFQSAHIVAQLIEIHNTLCTGGRTHRLPTLCHGLIYR